MRTKKRPAVRSQRNKFLAGRKPLELVRKSLWDQVICCGRAKLLTFTDSIFW